jgi:hypothetical protein
VEINELHKLLLNFREIHYRPGKGRKGRKGTQMLGNPVRCTPGRPRRIGLSRRSWRRRWTIEAMLARNRLALNAFCMHFYFHAENLTTSAKNEKTYRRLFGMIYFRETLSSETPVLQHLANSRTSKISQKRKAKQHFYFAHPPFFCQNAPFL